MLKLTVGLALVTLVACLQCSNNDVCEAGQTCCQAPSGDTSCCPLHHGECCEDHLHCCPEGMLCQVKDSMCQNATHSLPWAERLHVEQTSLPKDSNVPCDDTAACPDESTCCKTKDGGWACCPLPEAVCCEDFVHCCPHGQKCNMASEKCESSSGSVPWFGKIPVRPISSLNSTDTQVSSTSDVPCDGTVTCSDDSTCCKTKEGGWACCPLPEAVCCEDFIHCCPNGMKCNVAAETCEDPSGSVPWFEKIPVQPISSQNAGDTKLSSSSDIPCDGTVTCSDDSTCCKTKEGGWACCPLSEAVCCDDFIHCCPHGTKCNLAAETCDDPSGSMPWFEKMPVRPISNQNSTDTQVSSTSDVPCDDTVACPDGSTCCKTKEGEWACCPLPEAVCCEDFVHCCPHGQKCNLAAQSCDDPSGSVPWFEKLPTRPREGLGSHENMSCDSSHSCPESNTCCKNIDGDWNCCPMPEAVCCWDHLHCCPQGFTCNFITLTCDSGSSSVPMTVIIPGSAKEGRRQTQHEEVKEETGVRKYNSRVPCDAHTSCPDHTTCCLIAKTSKWGCCPLPNAVCCKDGDHCCPAGYECDVIKVTCVKKDAVIPWYKKIPAKSTPAPSSDLGDVKCDDQTSCETGSTCCRLSTGDWGCCPLPEAVCCPDHEHCCPKGYTCDAGGSCMQNTWLQVDRVPLTHTGGKEQQPISSVKDIQCADGHSCLDSETCCKTSETTWACCPSPKAVCCDDMKHCCPAGYTCSKEGVCSKPKGLKWNSWGN
ncbi:granulin a isoform X2 [Misgurnus anguillicaudatus]|uniref:granulin a isoform X2 n=1 Tax=Misgurnus anguillicaudatus TaxID=75329 RepID=UPI003CCF345F